MKKIQKEEIASFFRILQDNICKAIEHADGKAKFIEDNWKHEQGGGGRSRIIQAGDAMEKGGVNISEVHGILPDNVIRALDVSESAFYVTGISIVMHPVNPFVSIIHMNLRYFELNDGTYWFGGGIDLTPHYINKKEATYFHDTLKGVCDKYDPGFYPKFKKWADEYFFIKHRNETRGIGGIFFDRLKESQGTDKNTLFEFVKAVGEAFAPTYTKFIAENKNSAYTEKNKQWQLIRRGRYVEFNLVYDRGTKFGLDTNGRIESILMSLPPFASWPYNFIPEIGSEEEKTLDYLKGKY